jgi:hypothetical protein
MSTPSTASLKTILSLLNQTQGAVYRKPTADLISTNPNQMLTPISICLITTEEMISTNLNSLLTPVTVCRKAIRDLISTNLTQKSTLS